MHPAVDARKATGPCLLQISPLSGKEAGPTQPFLAKTSLQNRHTPPLLGSPTLPRRSAERVCLKVSRRRHLFQSLFTHTCCTKPVASNKSSPTSASSHPTVLYEHGTDATLIMTANKVWSRTSSGQMKLPDLPRSSKRKVSIPRSLSSCKRLPPRHKVA